MERSEAKELDSIIEDAANEFKLRAEPVLNEIKELRNSRIFPMFFAPGIPIMHTSVDSVYSAIHKLDPSVEGDMDVILFSEGGDPHQSYLLANMLQESVKGELTLIVPRYAKSAATILACAGNTIAMGPPSELGFVEPIVVTKFGVSISAKSVIDTLRTLSNQGIRPEAIKEAIGLGRIPVEKIADHKRSAEHIRDLLTEILKARMLKDEQDKACKVADSLCSGPHGASITNSDAKRIGLKIEDLKPDIWNCIWKLHEEWTKIANIETRISYGMEKLHVEMQEYPLGEGIFIIAKPAI